MTAEFWVCFACFLVACVLYLIAIREVDHLRAALVLRTAERNTARRAVQDAHAAPLADVVQGPWGGAG